jgi:hypothetical protein
VKNNIFIILLFLTCGCLDKIELEVSKEIQDILVIQGGLVRNNDKAIVEVQARQISDEKGQSRQVRVKMAYVENDLNQIINLNQQENGLYTVDLNTNSKFDYAYGRKFRIFVESLSGQKYMSTFKELLRSPKIDNSKFKIVQRNIFNSQNQIVQTSFVELYIDTKLIDEKGNPYILKHDIVNSFKYTDQLFGLAPGKLCYVSQKADLNNVALYDGRASQVKELKDFPVYDRKIDYVFSEGYFGTIIQQAIDDETFNYFNQINELNNRDDNIYQTPAGKLITNIINLSDTTKNAFGYFYAVTQDTARIKIKPTDVGSPNRQCPVPPSESSNCPVRACCDCLGLSGSTLTKPLYWN